ncbi:MAG: NAD-dependent epimerase/dehydratase family protein [Pseudonocardiaceae bacterium]|nr:NAD-dependent epimerase/dehydratase family protein [Pseudonocardiaceae bacterium]
MAVQESHGRFDPADIERAGGLAGRSIAVLGATGFLGRHICTAFSAAGASVCEVSRTAQRGDGRTRRPVELDLVGASSERLAEVLADADVIVNAAGMLWGATEEEMAGVNSGAVVRLAELVPELPRSPRFIQLGTVHEYRPAPVGSSIAEDQPVGPVTAYGRTKLRGSQAVLRATRMNAMDGVVLRIGNAFGPGTPNGSLLGGVAGRLSELARSSANGMHPARLRLAPLRTWREFIDVRDIADAVVAVTKAPMVDLSQRIINVGRGQALEVRWLVDQLITVSGIDVQVVEEQPRDAQRSDVVWQQLNISRARQLMHWRPRRGVRESLRDLLAAA